MISFEVDISPVELEGANQWFWFSPEFSVVDIKGDGGSIELLNTHTREFEEHLLIKNGIISLLSNLKWHKWIEILKSFWFRNWH